MTSRSTLKPRSHAAVSSTADGDLVTLSGDIDDLTRLGPLLDQVGSRVFIDLGGVTFINSVGVREWMTLLDALARRGAQVTLRNVAEPMVRQMTMVLEARGDATIESFYAPYVCHDCGEERSLVLSVEGHRAELAAGKPPSQSCPACGERMDFDEFPNRYLSFLA